MTYGDFCRPEAIPKLRLRLPPAGSSKLEARNTKSEGEQFEKTKPISEKRSVSGFSTKDCEGRPGRGHAENKANLPACARKSEALNPKSETDEFEKTKPMWRMIDIISAITMVYGDSGKSHPQASLEAATLWVRKGAI